MFNVPSYTHITQVKGLGPKHTPWVHLKYTKMKFGKLEKTHGLCILDSRLRAFQNQK